MTAIKVRSVPEVVVGIVMSARERVEVLVEELQHAGSCVRRVPQADGVSDLVARDGPPVLLTIEAILHNRIKPQLLTIAARVGDGQVCR